MDRTEASDAFNAGSIPVGCISSPCCSVGFKKGFFMLKKIWNTVYDFVWKNSKWMLPLLLVVVVAIVVAVALKAKDVKEQKETVQTEQGITENAPDATPEATPEITQVPLVENTNEALHTLICTYYNAYAEGDVDTIKSISNYVKDTDEITIPEMSVYVEQYPMLTIYTKEGPVENSYLAYVYYQMKVKGFEETVSGMETFYVCTNADGSLYLNRGGASQEELDYIQTVSLQEDVVELYNRVTVECSDTFANNAELYYYIQEIVNEVQKNTGEQLAAGIAGEGDGEVEGGGNGTEQTGETLPEGGTTDEPVTGGEDTTYDGPIYAKATTTVNVRSSDSEQADKIDKVTSGTKVEVLEQRVNGWTKVKVNGNEGFIKSEFLNVITVVNPGDSVGQVTATSNVNVRAAASQDAERLGLLTGGTTVELLENQGEWSKINYNGQVGYVKSEFLQ